MYEIAIRDENGPITSVRVNGYVLGIVERDNNKVGCEVHGSARDILTAHIALNRYLLKIYADLLDMPWGPGASGGL